LPKDGESYSRHLLIMTFNMPAIKLEGAFYVPKAVCFTAREMSVRIATLRRLAPLNHSPLIPL
jgi:hypothetical protein